MVFLKITSSIDLWLLLTHKHCSKVTWVSFSWYKKSKNRKKQDPPQLLQAKNLQRTRTIGSKSLRSITVIWGSLYYFSEPYTIFKGMIWNTVFSRPWLSTETRDQSTPNIKSLWENGCILGNFRAQEEWAMVGDLWATRTYQV